MTDGTRILRTAGIPLIIGFIVLFAMPKMCVKAVIVSKERQEAKPRASGGLHIESSQKPLDYPSGLDADRVQYLIETDSHFEAPSMGRVSKTPPAEALPSDQPLISALQRLGYVETGPDGAVAISREGLLHLDGLVDDGSAWNFLIAKRVFRSVKSIENAGEHTAIRFTWQWQPTSAGAELIPKPRVNGAKAELTNVTGRWTLGQISDLDDDLQ
ncbi:MAG: hypothetical protein QOK37_1029 [Thermoanaerobaculia bacterium]|jgi:hypothetical protein|nr:hypothetical protein [Thermoanaerobaculia bacterium]